MGHEIPLPSFFGSNTLEKPIEQGIRPMQWEMAFGNELADRNVKCSPVASVMQTLLKLR